MPWKIYFELIGEITQVETFAVKGSIRDLMKRRKPQAEFVLCIQNEGCDDLEIRKVYQVLPDQAAAQDGYLRVIDESGEDYLYQRSIL